MLLVALAACGQQERSCAWLDPTLRYCLQPTSAVDPFDQRQKLVLSFKGQPYTLLADLQVDSLRQQMILLTPLGQTIAQLSFDNRAAVQEGPAVPWPAQLSPAALLGLVQLAWWPTSAVRVGLDNGWVVEDSPGLRQIRPAAGGLSLVDIGYSPYHGPYQQIRMTLPQQKVTLDIEVLETEPSAP